MIRPALRRSIGPGDTVTRSMSRWRSSLYTVALHLAAHPLGVLTSAAAVAAVVRFAVWEFAVPPSAWLLFAVVGARLRTPPVPGRPVRPVDEPELAALVKDVAEQIGFRAPISLRMLPTVDAGLARVPWRSGHAFALLLGWPLLRGLTAHELRAVVAHELAHEQHTADAATARLLAARQAAVDSLDRLVHLPRQMLAPLLRHTQPISFALELAADRDSAELAGPEAVASALRTTERVHAAYEVLAGEWLSALEEREQRPGDLFEEMDRALADPTVQQRLNRMIDGSQPSEPDVVESHPSLTARIAAVGAAGAAGNGIGGAPMTLHTAAALDAWCLETLGVDLSHEPVRLAELDLHALRLEDDDPLADLAAATGSPSHEAARAAALAATADGSWRAIADRLEPDLARAPDAIREFARRSVFSGRLSRALAADLRQAGWHPSNRWVVTQLARPGSPPVLVRDMVEDALDTGDPWALYNLLAASVAEEAG